MESGPLGSLERGNKDKAVKLLGVLSTFIPSFAKRLPDLGMVEACRVGHTISEGGKGPVLFRREPHLIARPSGCAPRTPHLMCAVGR